MADDKKPLDAPPVAAAPPAPPTNTVVYVAQPPPHVPPVPNDTPPGGKFGIREVEFVDGKRVETIKYVNAHNLPYTDDADDNLKEKASDRRDMRDRK